MEENKEKTTGEKEKEKGGAGALFIPAGLFIGMGVGFLLNHLPAGILIGLGIGFALFALSSFAKN